MNLTNHIHCFVSVTLHEKSAVQMTDTFQQAFPTCNITGATNLTTINPPITTESTSFMTSSVKVSIASTSSITPENCVCLQKCTITNFTELEETIERIIRNLTINKKVTSKYKRKFVSADDSRQSAQVMGTVAIVFIAFVSLSIVFLDYGIVFFKILVRIKVIVWIGNNGTVGKITRIHVQQEQATTSTV